MPQARQGYSAEEMLDLSFGCYVNTIPNFQHWHICRTNSETQAIQLESSFDC